MKSTARKLIGSPEEPIDTSRARLVRRGPKGQVGLTLRGLREAAGLTQAQVAKASGIVQPEISKLEAAPTLDDRMVATIRKYAQALGAELDLVLLSKYGHQISLAGTLESSAGVGPATALAARADARKSRTATLAWKKLTSEALGSDNADTYAPVVHLLWDAVKLLDEHALDGDAIKVTAARVCRAVMHAVNGRSPADLEYLKQLDAGSRSHLRENVVSDHTVAELTKRDPRAGRFKNADRFRTPPEFATELSEHATALLASGKSKTETGMAIAEAVLDDYRVRLGSKATLPGLTPRVVATRKTILEHVKAELSKLRATRDNEAHDVVRAVYRGWARAIGAKVFDPFVGARVSASRARAHKRNTPTR